MRSDVQLSPCVKKCSLSNNVCTGCTRTVKEIMEWSRMTTDARMEIMKQLRSQISTHDCPKCGGPAYCAMDDGKSASSCWCMGVSSELPVEEDTSCMCRACLTKEVKP